MQFYIDASLLKHQQADVGRIDQSRQARQMSYCSINPEPLFRQQWITVCLKISLNDTNFWELIDADWVIRDYNWKAKFASILQMAFSPPCS